MHLNNRSEAEAAAANPCTSAKPRLNDFAGWRM